jgi:UDP-glucose 4-epimerase
VYGASKLAFERAIESAEEADGLRAVRLRYFNVAGAWPDGSLGEAHEPESHIVPRILRVAVGADDRFTIFGKDYPTDDGTCVRDYLHVADLADAHARAIRYLTEGGAPAVCNLGSGCGYSNLQVLRACEEATGVEIPVDVGPRRPGDPARLVASVERAREVLGWSPTRDLYEMVAHAWQWHRTHPSGYADAGSGAS